MRYLLAALVSVPIAASAGVTEHYRNSTHSDRAEQAALGDASIQPPVSWPKTVRSVREVNVTILEKSLLPNGFFTKFEQFHGEQMLARELRERLQAQNSGAALFELNSVVLVRGGSDRTGAKFIDSYGEIFALAYSAELAPHSKPVNGWSILIYDRKARRPLTSQVYYQTGLSGDAVVVSGRGLQMTDAYLPAIRSAIADYEKIIGKKLKAKDAGVTIVPLFDGQDASRQVNFSPKQSREFLFSVFNCELLLTFVP